MRPTSLTPLYFQDCYQCGKCTAGCPVAERMDFVPNQVIRLVQLGRADQAMRCESIWLCVSCQTCSTRCPQSVDCAGAMDALREAAVERGLAAAAERRTVLFQRAFLKNIRRNGRLNEVELIGAFKTSAFLDDLSVPLLFKDALLASQARARGKLRLTGGQVRDRAVVERIFDRCLVRA